MDRYVGGMIEQLEYIDAHMSVTFYPVKSADLKVKAHGYLLKLHSSTCTFIVTAKKVFKFPVKMLDIRVCAFGKELKTIQQLIFQ